MTCHDVRLFISYPDEGFVPFSKEPFLISSRSNSIKSCLSLGKTVSITALLVDGFVESVLLLAV